MALPHGSPRSGWAGVDWRRREPGKPSIPYKVPLDMAKGFTVEAAMNGRATRVIVLANTNAARSSALAAHRTGA